jgi:hypothetical protein
MGLRPLPRVDTGEGGERQQRPFGVRSGDEASAQPLQHCEISCRRVNFMTSFGQPQQVLIDDPSLHPVGGFNGPHPGH